MASDGSRYQRPEASQQYVSKPIKCIIKSKKRRGYSKSRLGKINMEYVSKCILNFNKANISCFQIGFRHL